MKDTYWLNDKLAAAELPKVCAQRYELINMFQRETSKPLVFVSAPAGYGKTISTLLWLKSSGRETIWIGLDGYDNSLSVFYKQFCTALLSIQPENKAMENILRSPDFASSPVEHTVNLLSEFVPERRLCALVFDDMHLITNGEIRKSLISMLRRLPLSFVTIVLTRNVVAEEYLSIYNGKVAVITEKELAFSKEEIQKYFSEFERNITAEEAAAVHAVTGGWAIGVNALAMSGQMEFGQKNGQILESYIKSQIWDHWDEDLRNFILKTSIVDEMTASLCNKLTGLGNSGEILAQLYRANSFVTHIGGEVYRYHQLFIDFLRKEHTESDMDTKALYKAAAEYYIENKEPLIARDYALKSEDADSLINIVFEFNQGEYCSGSFDEFINSSKAYYSNDVPETICDRYPFLYMTHLWLHYLSGNAHKTEYYLDKLYQHLSLIENQFPQFLELIILMTGLDYRMKFSEQIERLNNMPQSMEIHEKQQGISFTMQLPFLHRGTRCYCELADETILEKWRLSHRPLIKGNYELITNGIN